MNEPNAMTQWLSLGMGILGVVLGVFNTWRQFERDRVKLRVVPKLAKPVLVGRNRRFFTSEEPMPDAERICVEVINAGHLAVTLDQIGFLYVRNEGQGIIPSPMLDREGSLPVRLEPRSSVTAYLDPLAHRVAEFARVRCAFAKTECGKKIRGKSAALAFAVRLAGQQ